MKPFCYLRTYALLFQLFIVVLVFAVMLKYFLDRHCYFLSLFLFQFDQQTILLSALSLVSIVMQFLFPYCSGCSDAGGGNVLASV